MTPLTQVDPPPSTDDQRGRVLAAASVAFAARGYHDTSLEEISSESGVDSRALSEMFPDRYDILRDVSRGAVRVFMQCADAPVGVDARQARTALNGIITSLTRASIEHRAAGAVCRTEYRYLRPDDAELLLADLNELRARVQRPLMVARPELSDVDADILATAALSTISSITIHTTPLAEPKIETLLTLSAMRLLDSEPATIADARPQIPAASPPWRTDTSERGTILAAGIDLFYRRGFKAVTIGDIADRAGVGPERVLHYFTSTSSLLHEACLTAYRSVEAETERALASSTIARDTLIALSHARVWHSFEDPELMTVYLTEGRNLDPEHQAQMARLYDYSYTRWVRMLGELRPEISDAEAGFLIFAQFSIVSDLGHLARWKNDDTLKAKIEKCVLVAIANLR